MKNNKEMLDFCGRYKHIFLYQFDENQDYVVYIQKYLSICSVEVKGIIIPDRAGGKNVFLKKTEGTYWTLNEVREQFPAGECGILLTVCDFLLNAAYEPLIRAGFQNLFFMTEYYKNKISEKLRPRKKEDFIVEVNLADHCNLNCQMCDHFSPVAGKHFLDLETFINDMGRLADLANNSIGTIKLLGGEPLLNANTPDFLIIARGLFPQSSIMLYTNGFLLEDWETKYKANLWEICRRFNIRIMVTTYPVNFDYAKIDALAGKYNTPYSRFVEEAENTIDKNEALYTVTEGQAKKSVHHPFALAGDAPVHEFIDCYHFNKCITLDEGKLYTCPIIPYSKYFNAFFNKTLEINKDDFIDIHEARNFDEITEFCAKRAPFCRYCDVSGRKGGIDFKPSRKAVEEWT